MSSTYPSDAPFAGAYMKLHRAAQFIQELEAERQRYEASKPYIGRLHEREDSVDVEIAWNGAGLLVGAILGDAVHNIRSALDLLACELVRMNQKSDNKVSFPFASEEAKLDEQIINCKFHKAGQAAVDLLRSFAPYRGGNDDLRAVHDLDIQDKHRIIIPFEQTAHATVTARYNQLRPTDGQVDIDAKVAFLFPDESVLAGREVIQTLTQMASLVSSMVDAFKAVAR